tara:strand:+ start:92 stop:286 length:195 start_codon:yes stop_codon:yes gene_type:complete
MKSCFERVSVDMMRYNKHYNPKIKYLGKNILCEIYYDLDEDDENDVVFKSRYDVSDYDTLADLY